MEVGGDESLGAAKSVTFAVGASGDAVCFPGVQAEVGSAPAALVAEQAVGGDVEQA